MTRAQARLGDTVLSRVPEARQSVAIDSERLMQLQRGDDTIKKYRQYTEPKTKGQQVVTYEMKNDILCRSYAHPRVNGGVPVKQVVVPRPLRCKVMELAHDSILSGHLESKKTADKVFSNFYWPGVRKDMSQFCKSCEVCQRTDKKGDCARVPLQSTPLIDVPFKRVAVDLVGPIFPPSNAGHRYILTFIGYATRYPKAIPLKNISTESVAEALVGIYSRVGVPEEVLSDLGTQFISDCMKEVSGLLSIRQLTTTPYHPMRNGLVEKFNGTLKTTLRRLCTEKPKQWNRYIDTLLFAYREAPHKSTGFRPLN